MLKKMLVVVVIVVVLLVLLLVRDWDSPELGQAILDKAGEATGIEMSAEGFRLNLIRGLVLENVEARSSSSHRDVNVSLDRLVFEHRLAPLLSGTVAIESVVLERPHIELIESADTAPGEKETSPTEATTPAEQGGTTSVEGGLALAINTIVVEDGTMVIQSATGKTTRIEGLDLRFEDIAYVPHAEPAVHGFAAQGELGVRKISFDELEIRDAEAELSVAEGRFDLNPLRFVMDEGRFTAEMRVDFNPTPFVYSLSAQGDPLDFNAMVGADEGFGPGRLQLEAKGGGPIQRMSRVMVRYRLRKGSFPRQLCSSRSMRSWVRRLWSARPTKPRNCGFGLPTTS